MPLTAEKGSLYDLASQGVLPPSVVAELNLIKAADAQGTWKSKLQRPLLFHRVRSWFKTRALTLYDSGVDFSGTISGSTASCLRANRGGFVCVYIKWTGRGSIETYRSAGLRVVPIYETTGTDYRGGFGSGVNAANAFLAWCSSNGYQGAEVYFTFDEDVMGLGLSGLAVAYARGWNSVIGVSRCNAYGSSGLITALLNASVINRGWVTYAWSGGALDSRATLYQNPNNTSWCGLSTDNDRAFQSTIGAIGETGPPPTPPPPPPHREDRDMYRVLAPGDGPVTMPLPVFTKGAAILTSDGAGINPTNGVPVRAAIRNEAGAWVPLLGIKPNDPRLGPDPFVAWFPGGDRWIGLDGSGGLLVIENLSDTRKIALGLATDGSFPSGNDLGVCVTW